MKRCLNCGEEIIGRADKQFCDHYCRSNYHYAKNKTKAPEFHKVVEKKLKSNRSILKKYNRYGMKWIDLESLLNEGFDPNYFTHYMKSKNEKLLLFCYEYGFQQVIENDQIKFELIHWKGAQQSA